ncbi:hypothetical protein ACLKA7_000634 [Drosophila subpalustris]
MDFDCLHSMGSELGTGGIIVMCKDCDPLLIMQRTLEFYMKQTCKQCTPCRDSAIWLPEISKNFTKGESHPHMIDLVDTIQKRMRGTCICGLAEGHANVALALAQQFGPLIEKRILEYAKDC